MAIPWGALKSLLIFFGPMLLPTLIGRYRRLKAEASRRAQQQGQPGSAAASHVRPLSARSAVVLGLLAGVAVGYLMSAGFVPSAITNALHLPPALSMPENIFAVTQSRLQAPTDVVFTRLSAHRPNHTLTATDEALRSRLASLETRLLYLQYGPDVLASCPFCGGTGVDSANKGAMTYFFYALVDLLALHVANLVLIAIVTSPLLLLGRRGKVSSSSSSSSPSAEALSAGIVDGAGESAADLTYDASAAHIRWWRTPASIIALCLAALDVYMVYTYDRGSNARALRLADVDMFFWTMRKYRGIVGGLLLGALAIILYWAATGMHSSPKLGLLGVVLFGSPPPPSPAHRITAATRTLAGVKSKLSAGAIIKNTAQRDADLRARTQGYWAREVMLVAEAMEEREVIEGVTDALQNRIDIQRIERDAEVFAQNVVPSFAMSGSEQQQQQPQPQASVSRSSTPVAAGATATKRK